MSNKPLVKINGGFPPIKEKKINKKETQFSKERNFTSSNFKTVKISDIIKTKKDNIIKKDNSDLEIIDSL